MNWTAYVIGLPIGIAIELTRQYFVKKRKQREYEQFIEANKDLFKGMNGTSWDRVKVEGDID